MNRRTEILILIVFALFVSLVTVFGVVSCQYNENIESLDKQELGYDADDYFILIDTNSDIVGLYYGSKPLNHFKQNFEKYEKGSIITTLKDLPLYGIVLNDEILSYICISGMASDTPVMILS